MAATSPRQQREQNSVWLAKIVRGDKSIEKETCIRTNFCRFSFRACKLTKISNPCTKEMYYLSKCTCAYDHEYFMYIKDDGSIDEEIFNKILMSVASGTCPHVKQHTGTPTAESSVTAKHVFGAIGHSDKILAENTFVPTSCFGITPYHVATIHRQHSAIKQLSNIYNFCKFKYPTRTVKTDTGIRFDIVTTNSLKLCIDKEDTSTLKTILGGVTNAYQYNSAILYAIHYGKTKSLDVLLTSYNEFMNILNLKQDDSFQGTFFAVLSNRPESLNIILENLDICSAFNLEKNFTLSDLAKSLGHSKCFNVLENWKKTKDKRNRDCLNHAITNVNKGHAMSSPISAILFKLKFHNLRQFETENLCQVLRKLVENGNDINHVNENGKTPLHYVCTPDPFFDIKVHFTLLELGADINVKDSNGETALFPIFHNLGIHQFYKKDCLKWFIRMALYHNPVRLNIRHWSVLSDQIQFKRLDNIYNGLCEDFIECGFQPSGYTEVRSLQKICRDSLRQRFPGTSLHRFIQETEMPPSFKDFILMKSRFDWQPHLDLHK